MGEKPTHAIFFHLPNCGGLAWSGLPTVRIVAARKIEWPRQRRLVPAHTPARALHHAQRHRIRARREGVIGELTLARQNFGPGIEERTRLDRNPRPRTILLFLGLGLDRRYVNHRCSEHCKAQPGQAGFNAHEAPRPKFFLSIHHPGLGNSDGTRAATTLSPGVSNLPLSSEPRIAVMSASMCPRLRKSIAWRCANEGARILHLYGRLVPSDTR